MAIRHDWSVEEVLSILISPLGDLIDHAKEIHREFGDSNIQQCELLSVKTGSCPEDCGYCSQSAHVKTDITNVPLLSVDEVVERARAAKERGASRYCLGAAWRDIPQDHRFQTILNMVRAISNTGLEVCCTMGMATESQLREMKEAGLHSYNHNIDTSREYYPKVVSTRTYDERLDTLKAARRAGVALCSGGILGLGESVRDRAAMLWELARMNPHPESVPINLLAPIENTPMEKNAPVPFEEFLRVIATARILMPRARVRLSAGRNNLSKIQQLECFHVGANSIFVGDKLLTAPNVEWEQDRLMLRIAESDEIRATD